MKIKYLPVCLVLILSALLSSCGGDSLISLPQSPEPTEIPFNEFQLATDTGNPSGLRTTLLDSDGNPVSSSGIRLPFDRRNENDKDEDAILFQCEVTAINVEVTEVSFRIGLADDSSVRLPGDILTYRDLLQFENPVSISCRATGIDPNGDIISALSIDASLVSIIFAGGQSSEPTADVSLAPSR